MRIMATRLRGWYVYSIERLTPQSPRLCRGYLLIRGLARGSYGWHETRADQSQTDVKNGGDVEKHSSENHCCAECG